MSRLQHDERFHQFTDRRIRLADDAGFRDGRMLHECTFDLEGSDQVAGGLDDVVGAPEDAGVLVVSVVVKSPAARAGLIPGDVILSVDGVAGLPGLAGRLRGMRAGQAVRLALLRAGRLRERRHMRTADLAQSIFKVYVVPFEAVSILLLAALVGAIVLARRD